MCCYCCLLKQSQNSLFLSGQGDLGPLANNLISDNIRHSCISVSQLCDLCDLDQEVKFSKEKVELCLGCDSVSGSRKGRLYLFPLVKLVSLSSPVTSLTCRMVDLQIRLTV